MKTPSLHTLLASAMLFGTAAFAADGDLDTSYNTPNGFNSVSFGASDNVYGGILQPDGKLIVIGGARPVTNQEMSVARYNADGTLDTGFGTSGKFSIDITVATSTDRGTCGGLQSDGKIIIGGYTRFASGNDNFAVIRLNTNGTLDTTFGISGIAQVDFNAGSDRANALVILPDNSIVLTGFAADFSGSLDIDLGVAKLTPNGALDTTFDTDGKMTVDIGDQQDNGNGLALQSDGKIVFCGQSFGTGVVYSVVGRLTATGALDATFGGGDGLFTSTIMPLYALRSVIVDPDGKIVAAGDGQPSGALDGLVMRLTTAGDLDTTFNTTGYLNVNFGSGSDFLSSVVRQADGKYIAGGNWLNSGTGFLESVVMKVTSAGALDGTFGTGGIKKIALGSGNNRVAGVYLASTGKVLVSLEGGASSAENFIAARFQNTVDVVAAPEIVVTESAANVADGGTFSFGTTTVGTPVTKTFTVTNSGSATLNLSALSVPSGFTIAQNFGSSTVAASGGMTTFQITMTAGAAATPSGMLTFVTDDADENPYNFTISGTVTASAITGTMMFTQDTGLGDGIAQDGEAGSSDIPGITMQVINITDTAGTFLPSMSWQNNVWLNSGDSGYSALTYDQNAGTKGMAIKSSDGSEFQLNQFLYYNWGETSSTTITVKGYRNTVEVASATFAGYVNNLFMPITVSLDSTFDNVDDVRLYISAGGYLGDQSATNHSINSIVVAPPVAAPAAPEIAVTETVAGDIPDNTGTFSFGSTTVGSPVTKTFTVTNSGTAALTLSNLTPPSGFAIAQNFGTTTVAASGGQTTFQIVMGAGAPATPSGTLTFDTNDSDENPFNFTISGTVVGSNNADLSALTTTATGLTPAFGAATTTYNATVPNGTTTTTVTATRAQANATLQVQVNGGGFTPLTSGVASGALNLNVGANPIDVKVTAQDGTTIKTYTIIVTRAGSSVSTLTAHSYSAGSIAPPFASGTFSYSMVVPTGTISTTMTAVKADANSTVHISINGGGFLVVPGVTTGSLGLNVGDNTFITRVTAQDGVTTTSYTTIITRAAPPATFDLAGNAVTNTPFDGGETYIYSAGPPPLVPVTFTLGGTPGDATTGSGAPDASGTASIGKFDLLKRGGFLGDNGMVVFPGELLIGSGSPAVTSSPNTFMGIWKDDGTGLKLLARSGDPAPEAGGAVFDILPTVPAINDSGEVTLLATLALGAGSPATTTANDTGLWSELGGTGLQILIRENDDIPGLPAGTKVGAFASGAYATAHTGVTTGEAAFAMTMKGASTDTAILRTSIVGASTTAVGVVARQNTLAPGTTQNFGSLNGSFTDSMRMDATGNLVFVALLTSPSREGIWYQPVTGGAPAKVAVAGDTAPGTSGATFKNIKSPAIGSAGVITFRGFLNNDGDNAAGLLNDGIWRGTAGAITPILRRGDSGYAGMPGGSKVGNVWHGWLNNNNHGAWRAWLNVSGNGVVSSTANGDVNAIFTDINGAMEMAVKVGDAAPGIPGATFASMDLPVVGSDAGGGTEWVVFIGKVSGGGTTAGVNDQGIWRKTDAGAFDLVIRAGDTVTTAEGAKVVQKLDFPGSGTTDRRWEQPVMDNAGRLLIYVQFLDGSSSQVLAP